MVMNTRSGGSDAGLYAFVRALGDAGIEITLRFCDADHTIENVTVDAAKFDRVVAAGGDGTAGAVAYALRDSGVPLLIYPAGTANLLAMNLGMPLEPRALAEIALHGRPVTFDLGEIECPGAQGGGTQGFAVVAGAGYDAAIMETAQPLKSTFGAAAYLVAAVTNMAPTTARFELELDGEHVSTDGIAVLLANFGRLQFDVPVARGADPRDGHFDIAVVRSRSVAGLLPAVMSGLLDSRSTSSTPGIDMYSAANVTLSSYPPLRMQYDGEVAESLTPFAARVLPRAATLLIPSDSPYADSPRD